jgi:hypothetical protein
MKNVDVTIHLRVAVTLSRVVILQKSSAGLNSVNVHGACTSSTGANAPRLKVGYVRSDPS